MANKKQLLARVLEYTGGTRLCYWARNQVLQDIPILAYHRVCDIDDPTRFPFDIELVSASVDGFRQQMTYLRERYTPITFATLIDALTGKSDLPKHPVIVTFDDGFDDNYYNAFPVLKALEMSATIFLSTGYIGGERTFWFDELAHWTMCSRVESLEIDDAQLRLPLGSHASRRSALRVLLRRFKSVPNATRLRWHESLRRQLGAELNDFALSRPLAWGQVREMADAGIEFGSHSVSHPVLSQLEDDELKHELEESKRTIEEQVGQPVQTLSYPVGGTAAFNERVQSAVRAAGYALAVSYIHGSNALTRLQRYGLRRLHVERYLDQPYFSSMLAVPELF